MSKYIIETTGKTQYSKSYKKGEYTITYWLTIRKEGKVWIAASIPNMSYLITNNYIQDNIVKAPTKRECISMLDALESYIVEGKYHE